MGDAAFLLLASKPDIGLAVVALGVVVGSVSGWVVNAVRKMISYDRPLSRRLRTNFVVAQKQAILLVLKESHQPTRSLLEVADRSCDCDSSIGFISGRD